MRRSSTGPDRRGGFTLVELLVVITIIAILVSLTAAAVIKALGKSDEVRTRNEISQLANSVQAFKTQYQVGFIPDRIVLPPGFDAATAQYLTSAWPRLDSATLTTGTGQITLKNGAKYASVFAYWGITGTQPVTLHGDQCLVFFLGGAVDTSLNCIGFCTDPTDPMNPNPNLSRQGPFFEFPASRLAVLAKGSQEITTPVPGLPPRSTSHRSFRDIFGSAPYLYFSSARSGNDYANPTAAPSFPNGVLTWVQVNPYQLNATRFANASAFQIISAGKDTAFGNGGLNWPTSGGSTTTDGYDDVANFHPTQLGISAN